MSGLQIVVVCNKENSDLVKVSANLVKLLPKIRKSSVKVLDVREPPLVCDLCIHLNEPYAVWFPWAKANCLFVDGRNAEWNGYIDSFDTVVSYQTTLCKYNIVIPWKTDEMKDQLTEMINECVEAMDVRERIPQMPPLLLPEDCPAISVVTLVYNRPKFIENALLNLLHTDYPKEKIEWVVVDDSEPDQSPSNRVIQFQEKFAGNVVYVPVIKKMSIGAKRNLAVEKSTNSIILMMDDDDHYPATSFRRRVAYLLKSRRRYECAVCTTIAMYDLTTGISAVNVPPFNLSLGKRCSEATLTFTKDFWKSRKFDALDMAEGEAFLANREEQVVEMPPQQIIVAMTHGTNTSRRKVPEGKVGCFWGFPRELLEFLHGLVGVKVEAE